MMCKGVAVMRRRSDSWLNATQILKVAGFDKPQRTRILEREVQKGEHEKVQGGYGKYQGTWIPLERTLALCRQYGCEAVLRPIIDFQPEAKSPPLAPKHLVSAQSSKASIRRGAEPPVNSAINTRSSKRAGQDASSSSRTPSPIRSSPGPSASVSNAMDEDGRSPSPVPNRKRKHRQVDEEEECVDEGYGANGAGHAAYGDQILEYFISDSNQIPEILINPPPNFDPNMSIDDDGHTALHWASAMGRIRIVKLLLTAGADIYRVNKAGQTALMRSVMFANNYDVRKFPELYELLHRSTLNIDNSNRTVFHHIVDVAMSKGKTHAARYYMETVLQRLADFPRELADIINFQDEDGETALTMAARCRSKRLVKLLLDHGADPKIANHDGKTTEDYILEDERFRSSPVLPSRQLSFRSAADGPGPTTVATTNGPSTYALLTQDNRPSLHYSTTGQKTATRCVTDVTMMLDSLAAAFDQELKEKDRDLTQANALLTSMQSEILESQRTASHLKAQAQGLPAAQQTVKQLEDELHGKMGKRFRLGWEKWVKDDEERERAIRDAAGGHLASAAGEPVADLLALHADIPTDPEALRRECERLREELAGHRTRRKDMFDHLVKFQAEAGTGGRMTEYRRLISAGCGGIPPEDVDGVVGMLLETLEAEEPSSSAAWNGSARAGLPVG
ncbi:apses-domain-containing protein [Ganoderma leucocontextum]|nr:apses-domain-containing protein [Ganoderma leucocontextum]